MSHALRPGLSFCEASGHLVFLDIIQDRYFCLSDKAERALRSCILSGQLDADSTSQALIDRGLLVRAKGCSTINPTSDPPTPNCSLLDEPSPPPRWRWIFRAGTALASARVLLQTKGLASTLQRLRAARQQPSNNISGDDRVREIVGACERLNLVLSPLDQCLPRSVALAHLLARSGYPAQLVIGVRLRPFLAHSWVQQGDVLLNERVDIARTFTPILVI